MSKRRHGKYRDSRHYREVRGKNGNTAKVYSGGTTSKTVKSTGSNLSTGGYGSGSTNKWGMCMDRHYQQPIDLGNGLTIFASAWVDSPEKASYNKVAGVEPMRPDLGVYLDDGWASIANHLTSPGVHVPGLDTGRAFVLYHWRDYDVPDSDDEFDALLRWTLSQITVGKLVETGCFAGHGRTGTFLAGLMIMQGTAANDAIASVRRQQCKKCVETNAQREYLYDLDERVNGRTSPVVKVVPWQPSFPGSDNKPDEFGRRVADPWATLDEAVLNELDEEDAYETWLRLNSQQERDYTWCDYEDLPFNLCTCPDKMDDEMTGFITDMEWSEA